MRFFTERLFKRLKLMENFPFIDRDYVISNWDTIYKKMLRDNSDELHKSFLVEFPELEHYRDDNGLFMTERGINDMALGRLTYEAKCSLKSLDKAWQSYDDYIKSIDDQLEGDMLKLAKSTLSFSEIMAISMLNNTLTIEVDASNSDCRDDDLRRELKLVFINVKSAEISNNVIISEWFYDEVQYEDGLITLSILTDKGIMKIIFEDFKIKYLR